MRSELAKLPALRLLLPLCGGILTQWYLPVPIPFIALLIAVQLILLLAYHYWGLKKKFSLRSFTGTVMQLLIFTGGMALVWRNDKHSAGVFENTSTLTIARLDEPLSEKQNSYKSTATRLQGSADASVPAGKIIIYFKKERAIIDSLSYGSLIAFRKAAAPVMSSGNPGAFDLRRHNRFQGILGQVYLTRNEFMVLPMEQSSWLQRFVNHSRKHVVSLLRKYIPGKEEQGLAEALLIGYKDDLDKDLLRSYADTGVVHVIAISGLHLGIIYTILAFFTKPLAKKGLRWSRFLLILVGLWSFSLIAGAQASILRSAVMFSFLAAGTVLERKAPAINTLALSAFLLLCWKPFWLWDAGFQLSYSAVLSLVLLYRPVYNWFCFRSKLVDAVWKILAVTIAAQLLTLPLLLYYFHQFPLLFLYTNLLAVPASSLILLAELLLVAVGWFPPIAGILGAAIGEMIGWMNAFIRHAAGMDLQFSGISLSFLQAALLYIFIAFSSAWLLHKERRLLWPSLAAALLFVAARSRSFVNAENRRQLVVYNFPKKSAADIIIGRSTIFVGDSIPPEDASFMYHILPSRVQARQREPSAHYKGNVSFTINGKQIIFLGNSAPPDLPSPVIAIIISGDPRISISRLCAGARPTIVVDASVPAWKQRHIKKECRLLNIPCHLVAEDGAFVINL